MKRIIILVLTLTSILGLSACGSTGDTSKKETAISTEDSSIKKDKKMNQMKEDLEEKEIDDDYFKMTFDVRNDPDEVRKIILELNGNISGKSKEPLYYEVSKGRIVESSLDNTSINDMAKVLKSLDYSDKEILEFAQWYYNNNK